MPAHAAFKETEVSYYGRLMKSCERNTRETWRDYLMYARKKSIDECCAESVRQMSKAAAKLAPSNRPCPKDTQINQLKCTNSKVWCEPIKAK